MCPDGGQRPPPPPSAPVQIDDDARNAHLAADSRSIWQLRREIEHIQEIIDAKRAAGHPDDDQEAEG